jgi:hypothetical protein
LPDGESEKFLQRGLDSKSLICPSGRIWDRSLPGSRFFLLPLWRGKKPIAILVITGLDPVIHLHKSSW